MIPIGSKLNYDNLNVELMRHFARLQMKDDQVKFCESLLINNIILLYYFPIGYYKNKYNCVSREIGSIFRSKNQE